MKLLYVEMENILSIGHMRLDFEDSGLVLMDGWNYDDDSANGAGKTACFLGIPYAIWDKFPRKMTKSEILRKGTKKGFSRVGIQVAADVYEVTRYRPNKVEFAKNGQEIDMSQEEFEQLVGLSYSQYLICMYSAQTEGKKLIALNDTEKKDFILQLMDLEKFNVKKKQVDKIIKELEVDKNELLVSLAQYKSALQVYNEQKINTGDISQKIKELDYSELEKKLIGYRAIQKPDTSKYAELRNKVSVKISELDNQYQDYLSVKNKLQLAKDQFTATSNRIITCPSCSTDIVDNQKLSDVVSDINSRIKKFKDKLAQFPDFNSAKSQLNQILEKANNAQRKDEQEYLHAKERISEINSKIQIRKANIASLQAKIDENEQVKQKIVKIKANIDKANTKLKDVESSIEEWKTVSTILSPTGAPAYIMDAVIDVFNEKISDYVAEIWPNAAYRIQAFKENKSGDVKAKFSDKLVIAGKDRSIGSLSGGEYKCLSLAVDFAIMDVIESMFGIHMTPIVLDEPFEGLDASNRERAVALLEKKARKHQIWVIDHASEAKSMFSKIMRVEKRNGVSSIVI